MDPDVRTRKIYENSERNGDIARSECLCLYRIDKLFAFLKRLKLLCGNSSLDRWPFRSWDENFTKKKKTPKISSLYSQASGYFSFINPSSRKPPDNRRNKRITTAQVDTDGNHAHLHI